MQEAIPLFDQEKHMISHPNKQNEVLAKPPATRWEEERNEKRTQKRTQKRKKDLDETSPTGYIRARAYEES